jgi:DNA-binding winged helix-turn-helix (wHTH) protein/TolB-like protein/tetratricopeptide (TPR) repeat protein
MPLKTISFYEYGSFRLEPAERRLSRDGNPVSLAPKAFELLVYLVQNPGRLLTKEEILRAVWPDSFVEEANLTVAISSLRKVLGEKNGERYIETIPKKGYRFVAPVKEVQNPEPSQADLQPLEDLSQTHPDQSATLPPIGVVDESRARARPHIFSQLQAWSKAHWIIAAVTVLLITILALGIYHKEKASPPVTSAQRTLAILPLQNLKQTPTDDYLSFSLADAVITELAPVSSLTVRPSSAIEKYRGQSLDLRKVASELHVNTLLTGTFIHEGDDLRITYQIVDVKPDKILGKDTINLKYDRLMAVQDIVTQRVIQGLALHLPMSEAAQLQENQPVAPMAYEYYLRGVDKMASHDFPLAVEMLEKSTEIDPNYAPAWAYLGQSYNSSASFQMGGREQYQKARQAFERALALQPKQIEARIFLANFLIDTGEVEKAVPMLRDAQKDNPTNASLHWELGYAYRFAGMLNQSLSECLYARQMDPNVKANGAVLNTYLYLGQYQQFLADLPDVDDSSFLTFYRGFGEFYLNQSDQAAKDFDRAWQLEQTLYTQTGKALSHSIAHRNPEGLELLHDLERKIEQRGIGDPEGTYKIAEAYAVLGDKPSALRMLRFSIEHGFFAWPYFQNDPLLTNIRNEPQFTELLTIAHSRHQAFQQKFF